MNQSEEHLALTREDLRKHLDFIQAVVTRMSAASSNSKGWLLPVATAAYGFALTQRSGSVGLLGVFAVLVFSYIDANYLRQERAYRNLYNAVVKGDDRVPPYSLDPAHANDPLPVADPAKNRERASAIVRRWVPSWGIWLSWSIAPFYGSLFLLGMCVFAFAVMT